MLAAQLGTLCQITGADYKRPLGFLTTSLDLRSRVSLGWPHLENQHGNLRYKGHLPISCYCGRHHSLLIGITDTDECQTSTSGALGPKFWDLCVFDHSLETRFNSPQGWRTDRPRSSGCCWYRPSASRFTCFWYWFAPSSVRGMESWDIYAEYACRYIPGCDDGHKYFF